MRYWRSERRTLIQGFVALFISSVATSSPGSRSASWTINSGSCPG